MRVLQEGVCAVSRRSPRDPASCSPPISPPRFPASDEGATAGSIVAFVALHGAMLDRDQIGLAALGRSAASGARLVALLAQQEECDEAGLQVGLLPCGHGMRRKAGTRDPSHSCLKKASHERRVRGSRRRGCDARYRCSHPRC